MESIGQLSAPVHQPIVTVTTHERIERELDKLSKFLNLFNDFTFHVQIVF